MDRIGILGGTFNPPHLGHEAAARAASEGLGLTRLLLIPAGTPPHKPLPEQTAGVQERLEMTRLMARRLPGAEVCDLEIRRPGKSYTVDTVRQLQARFPGAALWLILGTDMLMSFDTWYLPEEIVRCCALAVVPRFSDGRQALEEKARFLREKLGARVRVIDTPAVEISSTDVRRALAGGSAQDLLAPEVLEYIASHGLYQVHMGETDLEQLRSAVRARLSGKRYRHTLGCEETAAALARRYGACQTQARAAAILHDITKEVDLPGQLKLCAAYDIIPDKVQRENAALLHALTAAAIAQRDFHMPEEVVRAIRYHTTGRAGMTLLEKIIYLADYIEPGRAFPGVEQVRTLAEEDIDRALVLALSMSVRHLEEGGNGAAIHEDTRLALAYEKEETEI